MSHLSTLTASELTSEVTAVQQKTYVTYTCLPTSTSADSDGDIEPTMTLLEHRDLIAGSTVAGFKTWDAALYLGSYLLTPEGKQLIEDKNVLELGAGTGFLSILCAKHLGAKHVTSTDGDEKVLESLRANLHLNDLDGESRVLPKILEWGQSFSGTWISQNISRTWPLHTVIGADIVRIS